jgi:hypothetical protein
MFSKTGKFIAKIERNGRGPGEYMDLSDFDIDKIKRQIAVLDKTGRKLIYYKYTGEFLNEINLDDIFSTFLINGNDILLYRDPIPGISKDLKNDYLLYIISGKSDTKYLNSAGVKKVNIGMSSVNFYGEGDDVKFLHTFCDTIYSLKNHTITPFLILESEKYRFTKEDMEKINNDLSTSKPSFRNLVFTLDKFRCFSKYGENDDMVFFEFKIGYGSYTTFYNIKSGKIICSKRYRDDMTSMNSSFQTMSEKKNDCIYYTLSFP